MCKTSHKALLCFALAQLLLGQERYEASEPHMGSVARIVLYASDADQAQRAFVAAFRRIGELNRILSDYDPQSELSRVCETGHLLSPELKTVIDHAQQLAEDTNGAFDITAGPLTRLWRNARRDKRLPADADVQEALGRSGHRKLVVSGTRVRCSVAGMQLDAGGIAKGYAADEALVAIRQTAVTSALVALSGDIATGDAPPGRAGWNVRVLDKTETLANAAVSTSGDEFQFLDVGGERYSHIINPRTGLALRNSRIVSVIAKKGIDADAVATAISVAPELADTLRVKRGLRITLK